MLALDAIYKQAENQEQSLAHLQRYLGTTGKIVDFAATMHDLKLAQTIKGGAGPLSQQLKILSKTLEEYGEKLPVGISKVITTYGKVTQQLLQATDKVDKKIRDNIDQGAIGLGAHSMIFSDKWRKAAAMVGDDKTLFPRVANLIYDISGSSAGLLWDEKNEAWIAVNNSESAEKTYHDALTGGKRLDANQLAYLVKHPELIEKLRKEAHNLFAAIGRIFSSPDFHESELKGELAPLFYYELWKRRNYDYFTSKYIYDGKFKVLLRHKVIQLHKKVADDMAKMKTPHEGLFSNLIEMEGLAAQAHLYLPRSRELILTLGIKDNKTKKKTPFTGIARLTVSGTHPHRKVRVQDSHAFFYVVPYGKAEILVSAKMGNTCLGSTQDSVNIKRQKRSLAPRLAPRQAC